MALVQGRIPDVPPYERSTGSLRRGKWKVGAPGEGATSVPPPTSLPQQLQWEAVKSFSPTFIKSLKLGALMLFPNEVTHTLTQDRIQRQRRLTLHDSELRFCD